MANSQSASKRPRNDRQVSGPPYVGELCAEKATRSSVVLRARVVVPGSGPVVDDGGVVIRHGRIVAHGQWRRLSIPPGAVPIDLGETILLPGLVNAHCHLDYTQMAGQLPPPRIFTDWLKHITSTKAGWSLADYSQSWLTGAGMLVRNGVTTVADIEAVPQLLPGVWQATPLRVISFLEMIGITSRRPPAAVLDEALHKIASLRANHRQVGLSPHAPYSTVPELLKLSAQTARRRRWRLCVHVAESGLEFTMFNRGAGEMFDWLRRSGRDMADCGSGSPVRCLQRCGAIGENLIAVHVNYLAKNDAAILGRAGASVVHCPRSHTYFRHGPFALRRLVRAGVNLCLGTDSLASVSQTRRHPAELSLFDEMRALAQREPWLRPRRILRMATANGARALGMQGQVGGLAPGAFADVIAVPWTGKISRAYDAILAHHGKVNASMIGGRWAVAPAGTRIDASSIASP